MEEGQTGAMAEPLVALATDTIRLTAAHDATLGMRLTVRAGDGWHDAGTLPWPRLVVASAMPAATNEAERRAFDLIPRSSVHTDAGVALRGTLDDPALGRCAFGIDLRIAGPREVLLTYWVLPECACGLIHFGGPGVCFDEAYVATKDDALFPGLEWLLGDEGSSDTANAAPIFARRNAPHPYKVTIPLMALSSGGAAVGLWWDPNQLWCNAHAYPGAEFALPDVQEGEAPAAAPSHRFGLFAPGAGSAWTAENSTVAHKPLSVPAGARLTLTATLCAGPAPRFPRQTRSEGAAEQPVPAHGSLAIVDRWREARGDIAPPDSPRPWSEALALCLRSFTAQCWDADARGWHHTLADPWGPRYEPGVAAQLWQAARRGLLADPEPARAMVRAGVAASQASQSQGPCPHLDLAFAYGGLETASRATDELLAVLIARQRADGGFPFIPKQSRQQNLGIEGDTSSGVTGEAAVRLLRHARITGNRACEEAGLRAMRYLRTQPRPEGAQTWELQVHVPDILAAAHGVASAIEAYRLTNEERYLVEAERWALAGLPFIYLWNPLFRPIMRYGSVPVFGATYFDAQSWFGVLVQWNGLVYARAVLDLATLRPGSGWDTVAQGVIACAVQQQAPSGPLMGMYPDAFSAIKGDEEYTWWLTPTLLSQALFALGGQPVEPATLIARVADGRRYHLSAADPPADFQIGERSFTVTMRAVDADGCLLFAGPDAQAWRAIAVDAEPLPEVSDLDAVAAGWRRPPGAAYVLIKPGRSGEARVMGEW